MYLCNFDDKLMCLSTHDIRTYVCTYIIQVVMYVRMYPCDFLSGYLCESSVADYSSSLDKGLAD